MQKVGQLPVVCVQLGSVRLRVCVQRRKEVCADRVSGGHWVTGSSAARDVGSSGAHDSRSRRRRRKVGFRRSGAHEDARRVPYPASAGEGARGGGRSGGLCEADEDALNSRETSGLDLALTLPGGWSDPAKGRFAPRRVILGSPGTVWFFGSNFSWLAFLKYFILFWDSVVGS